MFPIGSQLQANDVIVIISGAIARNVGHQVMKLLRIYSPPRRVYRLCICGTLSPGQDKYLACVCGTPVFSFKTRLFANARSGSPTNATENSSNNPGSALVWREGFPTIFPLLSSWIWFRDLYGNICLFLSPSPPFRLSFPRIYHLFFPLFFFFRKRGRRLASGESGNFSR